MQASLAVVGGVLGLLAWWSVGGWQWLAGALTLLANWPYTLLGIMPTNQRLEATTPETASGETRKLLERWGRLHAMRSVLGFVATLLFICALWTTPA